MFPWWRRDQRERDLDEELSSHLDMAARNHEERGEEHGSARSHARRELGNLGLIKEATRVSWGGIWRERILQDLRYALRSMRRNPGFSAVAVSTMMLGIGSTTAVFSLVKAALFSPEPYRDPGRLLVLKQIVLGDRVNTSAAEFLDFQRRSRVFEDAAGYESEEFDLTGTREPERVSGVRVTSSLFRTLGVAPLAGHGFSAAQDFAGGAREAVVSEAFARTYFGNPQSAIGRTIRLNERGYQITGVMPAAFVFPASKKSNEQPPPSLWLPMAFSKDELGDRAASYDISFIGRLKRGVSLADAQRDVMRVSREFQREMPEVYRGDWNTRAFVEPLGAEVAARRKPALILLSAGVALVLLIACVNLCNLLLARAGAREREMAARTALGASAGRLAVQAIVETVTLTVAGGLLGCSLAWTAVTASTKLAALEAILPANITLDGKALLFGLLLSLATGMVCGLAPLSVAWQRGPGESLKWSGRTATAARESNRLRSMLVVFEAALSVLLLIGSALLIRSFVAVLATPPGFDAHGVTIVRTSFNRQRYPEAQRRYAAQREIVNRLQAIPGVAQVALTTHLPLADSRTIGFVVKGRDPNEYHWADNANVDGAYFSALRIPLQQGRTFRESDANGLPVAIVNATMARQFWPAGDAVGKQFLWGGNSNPFTIIGVAGDVHLEALDLTPKPTIYMDAYQSRQTDAVFVLRASHTEAAKLGAEARKLIWSVDPGLPVFETASMQSIVDRSLAARRFTMFVLAAFAVLALSLAAIGLYGVLAYMVVQRTRELGVRLALGADPISLLIATVAGGMRLAGLGLVLGLGAAALLVNGMSRLLFGVRPLDPASFAAATAVLLVAALCAAAIPALRAAHIDPIAALRCE
ncbi:MAG TPA: ABC transporter permease [Bryobacteraceae bacterium]|jgi:predicted permease|nr:ABC transporter permease [Bryobacteraceae bacterium]